MANVKLIFCGTKESKTNDSNLEVLASSNEVMLFLSNEGYERHICLDKTTAVRLVRELKKQIGFLGLEGGNNNG
jgi:hypothetical protein